MMCDWLVNRGCLFPRESSIKKKMFLGLEEGKVPMATPLTGEAEK